MIRRIVVRAIDRLRCFLRTCLTASVPPPKPLPGYGSAAVFQLAAGTLSIPPETPEPLAELLREQRARFESGQLFGELAKAASLGAVIEAKIVEKGITPTAHVLRVLPADRRSST